MTRFDDSQLRVLELDPRTHARVLGAPGSGKTMLLIESFARISQQSGWREGDVLVLAANRLVASDLRSQIELRIARPIGGTFVRTASSLAFAVLQRHAALRGEAGPSLLTGTAHDEAIESVLSELLSTSDETKIRLEMSSVQARAVGPFAVEVLESAAFRAEMRELNRVLDDFARQPKELILELSAIARGESSVSRDDRGIPADMLQHWVSALEILDAVRVRLAETRSGEVPASALQRTAGEVLQTDSEIEVPKLVLVDDAAELGEGALALLASLVTRGTKIWAFGDPDVATGAFHGERTRVMAGLTTELQRAQKRMYSGAGAAVQLGAVIEAEQHVTLEFVHRHSTKVRGLVSGLTGRIGAAGAGQQRRAASARDLFTSDPRDERQEVGQREAKPGADERDSAKHSDGEVKVNDTNVDGLHDSVRFAAVATTAEQLGVVAHRLRAAHLGLGAAMPTPWSEMAVICRSRSEVKRAARMLAGHQVPSAVAAGGVVLREHQLVRDLVVLLQHALGLAQLGARDVLELLTGSIGGLDPISLRRLRAALRLKEVRAAEASGRRPASADELVLEFFAAPGERAVLDMRGARRLHRLGRIAATARAECVSGGTPREVLWQIWQGSGLATELQDQALDQRGSRADDAHRALDAVVGLFFALQRHEEQDSPQPVGEMLDELLASTVPTDSLAARSARDVVTITTPQGAIGKEFEVVCVLGVQDGVWPNLRARGSLLGVTALERLLRGDAPERPSRKDTMHDELRLFAHAVARAKNEVLVVSVSSEDQHPGPFFSFGGEHRVESALPSSRLTSRGAVAEMRRRLTQDPHDAEALAALTALAQDGVAGAHPDEWYGVLAPSSTVPLVDIDHNPEARVSVSPSQMERAESCPLDWIISKLGGGNSDYRTNIGTLLHQAMEMALPEANAEDLLESVRQHWGSLSFEAKWQEQRALRETESMAAAIAAYLGSFERSPRQLLAHEASFRLPIEFATLRGNADRIEATTLEGGGSAITVVDLKTGRRAPTAAELQQHAQLQAYQLGVLRGAFSDADGVAIEAASASEAKLLYVHPDTLNKTRQKRGEQYTEIVQAELSDSQQHELEQRVLEVGRIMAGASFTARLEHHCQNDHAPSRACSIHIIPAVSHA